MGLLLMVVGIAAVLSAVAALACYWTGRRIQRPRWIRALPIAVGPLVFVLSISPLFRWAQSATTTTAIDAAPDVADRVMAFRGLPPGTATDFSYIGSAGGTRLLADFQMNEEDYLNWMRSQGWEPTRIGEEGVAVYSVRSYQSGQESRVQRGWSYYWQTPGNPDSTERYTFDAEQNRGFVLITLW